MNKIVKFLKQLSPKERMLAEQYIEAILLSKTESFDVKKLKGHANLYRARKGDLRIIYERNTSDIRLIFIGRRNDNTYNDF